LQRRESGKPIRRRQRSQRRCHTRRDRDRDEHDARHNVHHGDRWTRATRSVEIRLEGFNIFNHPQFYGAGAVDGNIVSPTFGEIEAAAAPRFIQLVAKVTS
jgi:hypothetical protein